MCCYGSNKLHRHATAVPRLAATRAHFGRGPFRSLLARRGVRAHRPPRHFAAPTHLVEQFALCSRARPGLRSERLKSRIAAHRFESRLPLECVPPSYPALIEDLREAVEHYTAWGSPVYLARTQADLALALARQERAEEAAVARAVARAAYEQLGAAAWLLELEQQQAISL